MSTVVIWEQPDALRYLVVCINEFVMLNIQSEGYKAALTRSESSVAKSLGIIQTVASKNEEENPFSLIFNKMNQV